MIPVFHGCITGSRRFAAAMNVVVPLMFTWLRVHAADKSTTVARRARTKLGPLSTRMNVCKVWCALLAFKVLLILLYFLKLMFARCDHLLPRLFVAWSRRQSLSSSVVVILGVNLLWILIGHMLCMRSEVLQRSWCSAIFSSMQQ